MNQYTVTQVNDTVRDWNTQGGTAWKSYRVTLRNKDGRELGNVEISRPATAAKPEPGQTVEGTVDRAAKFGPKLQEPRKGGAGGGRARSPEERRSIAMQHAQKCAVQMLEIAATHGGYVPSDPPTMVNEARTLAAGLFDQVVKAEAGL